MDAPARLDRVFAALADPVRRDLVGRLASGPASVGELAAPLLISQPAVSRHLAVLEEAGVVQRPGTGHRRPCQLAPDGLADVAGWLDGHRSVGQGRAQRLEALRQVGDTVGTGAGEPG